jgi:hypothetical protein
MLRDERVIAAAALLAAIFLAGGARGQEPTAAGPRTWFDAAPAPVIDIGDIPPDAFDNIATPAAYFQPPAETPSTVSPSQPLRRGPRSQANIRLASVPNMFGDFAMISGFANVLVPNANGQPRVVQSSFGIPTAGSVRTGKIAENDSPIPVDRVFFNYNHFHNLFEASERPLFPPGAPPATLSQPLDRYTLGVEKTFLGGLYSVELRMPFNGTYDYDLQSVGIDGGNVGNLAVVLKSLLYMDDSLAVGAGLAIGTPTGSDTLARIGLGQLRIRNDAVHLLPYIGFTFAPGDPAWGWSDGLFLTGFAQFDIATNGNRVEAGPLGGPVDVPAGTFTEQNLLFLDIAAGYWLYRNPDAYRLTGLAAVGELHYTTSLQESDTVVVGADPSAVILRSPASDFGILNFTAGVQALLFDASSLRVAFAFPLGGENQRFFDSELQVQFNRRF